MAYIDREIAIKTAVENYKCNNHIDAVNLVEAMENIPSADVVEVVHAYWREGAFLKVGGLVKCYPSVICSDCGITFYDIINNHNYMYRYCPNCGAKMDGGKAE